MWVTVRSEVLAATAARIEALADAVRDDAHELAMGAVRVGAPPVGEAAAVPLLAQWVRLEGEAADVIGPGGLWGEALALDVLAAALRASALVYAEVEHAVASVLRGVSAGADLAARGGWLDDGGPDVGGRGSPGPVVRPVAPTLRGPLVGAGGAPARVPGVADLVAAGEGLGGGRVRVVETTRGDGGSAWVVVLPGTQQWSVRAGTNPFDLTTDVRALTGEVTVAATGVVAALDLARARSGRGSEDDPVLLVGHSQGGMLAAAIASDPTVGRRHRVTHLVTSGAPVALFPVPSTTRVLSLEHADDPVPRLDLTPNRADPSWASVVTPAHAGPVDLGRHRLEAYVATARTVEAAPRGTVAGLDAWQASAGAFLGAPVRSVSEVVVERAVRGAEEVAGQET